MLFSILIIAYFARNHEVRSKFKNHGWFVLIIVNFTQLLLDLPMPMNYYRMGTVWPASNEYCVWWTWCEFSLNTIGLFLMAWVLVERYVLIFHPHAMIQSRWKKWIFHFTPIILSLIWAPTLYLVLVVISPYCTNEWDFGSVNCGIPCYFTVNFLGQFDFIFNIAFPVMIITLANLALIIRLTYQKMSRHQIKNWRRHCKVVFQLGIVSSLYLAFWLPTMITELVQITVMPSFMMDQLQTILFVVYFIPLLLPMICLSTQPELVKKIANSITIRKLNVIGITTVNRGVEQAVTNTHAQ
ncbi:unnamed protein product [Rotaria socialis]|uniref:G-protein coupled receptors family 1 profile domain-containing protein n=1 Tax=Rotaria socialis TaxID=392032 RepID=A0A817X867_9BILA|nr:unnamed protein product [Rotaria socialis]CAF3397462.1 unnamed protein product [Rotaria socialis]CAF3492270.1 unnamed protein product [Rotaria socialis]